MQLAIHRAAENFALYIVGIMLHTTTYLIMFKKVEGWSTFLATSQHNFFFLF